MIKSCKITGKKKLPYQVFVRKRDKCWVEIESAYSPSGKERVYCEKCYLGAVY